MNAPGSVPKNTPTLVVVRLRPHPEHYTAVINLLVEVIPEIQQGPGCLLYALYEDTDREIVLIESWADRHAWHAHFDWEPILRLKKELPPWLATPVTRLEMYEWEASSA